MVVAIQMLLVALIRNQIQFDAHAILVTRILVRIRMLFAQVPLTYKK